MIRTFAAVLTILLWFPAITSVHTREADAGHPLDAHLTDSYTEDLDALMDALRRLVVDDSVAAFLEHRLEDVLEHLFGELHVVSLTGTVYRIERGATFARDLGYGTPGSNAIGR